MYHSMQKAKWAGCRIFLYVVFGMVLLSGGSFIFVAAPLVTYVYFNDLRFWKYSKHFVPVIICYYRSVALLLKDKDYKHMFELPLTAPPMTGPDRRFVKVSSQWKDREDDCARCIKCCLKIKCPLLDTDNKLCLSYNTVFWRYFNCGRYPVSQKQIDYYECHKWETC